MKKFCTLLTMVFISTILVNGQDGDRSKWRGDGVGIIKDDNWNPKALNNLKIKWSKELGEGYSAACVIDGKVLITGNKDRKNATVYCFDAKTGKEIWAKSYPSTSPGSYAGTRTTPVVSNSIVYTVSRNNVAHAMRLKDGSSVWSKDISSMGAGKLQWGFSGAVKVVDSMLILNGGKSGIALDAKTGRKIWNSSGKSGYAVPVTYTQNGKKMAAIFSAKHLHGVDVKTGRVAWSHPWETSYDVNAADPLIVKNYIFISSSYGTGCALINIGSGKPQQVWRNKNMFCHFSSPIYYKGYIFGVNGHTNKRGGLQCMDIKTGKVKWEQKLGFGSFFATDSKIIFLSDRGKLHVAELSTTGYKEVSSGDTGLGKLCWTMPVLANGMIYCRNNKGKFVAVDASK